MNLNKYSFEDIKNASKFQVMKFVRCTVALDGENYPVTDQQVNCRLLYWFRFQFRN
jgi:hypothetical protein